MNILLGLIAWAVCVCFGVKFSQKYTEKREFFADFYEFNKVMKNEILEALRFADKYHLNVVEEVKLINPFA